MKPILFSTPMVQAILAGNKTQTRRVVKFPADYNVHRYDGPDENGKHLFAWGMIVPGMCLDGEFEIKEPRSVGDVLWVRETWRYISFKYVDGIWSAHIQYKAEDTVGNRIVCGKGEDSPIGWQPSIHMSREAARLFLRVTSVRAERVQDISTSDCEEEGIASDIDRFNGLMTTHHDWIVGEYAKLWDNLNAKRGHGWDANPWVWVISFEKTEKPGVEG